VAAAERNFYFSLGRSLFPRKRKLGKYTTMIGNIGSDNFIGRKLKTG
jgi:hypothetical protein